MTDNTFPSRRKKMVKHQIASRGIKSDLVLNALNTVPREKFVPKHLEEFAYEDTPLPIGEGQTISQPYIVALMIEILNLKGGEKVLEIGAGSGYAAAILGQIAKEVYTVERIGQIASKAASTVKSLGYSNIHVLHGDGTLGWPDHAPYDAIIVAAGGPTIPESLKSQLKVGGKLVIPVGPHQRAQELVLVTRISELEYKQQDIADVGFVPLIGEEGWAPENESLPSITTTPASLSSSDQTLVRQLDDIVEPIDHLDQPRFDTLLDRIGDSKIVLLGEASHGTREFYDL